METLQIIPPKLENMPCRARHNGQYIESKGATPLKGCPPPIALKCLTNNERGERFGMNYCENLIMSYWGNGIKHLSIEPKHGVIELRTLILKPGFRDQKIGSQIITYLKRWCDRESRRLLVPMGTSFHPERLRNFYRKNDLTQATINDYEYWVYNYKNK